MPSSTGHLGAARSTLPCPWPLTSPASSHYSFILLLPSLSLQPLSSPTSGARHSLSSASWLFNTLFPPSGTLSLLFMSHPFSHFQLILQVLAHIYFFRKACSDHPPYTHTHRYTHSPSISPTPVRTSFPHHLLAWIPVLHTIIAVSIHSSIRTTICLIPVFPPAL